MVKIDCLLCLRDLFYLHRLNQERSGGIFPRRQIVIVFILPVPFRAERIRPDGELIEFCFLMEHPYELSPLIINAETDFALQRWRNKTDPNRSCRGRIWTG